jgi:hypothetical protein
VKVKNTQFPHPRQIVPTVPANLGELVKGWDQLHPRDTDTYYPKYKKGILKLRRFPTEIIPTIVFGHVLGGTARRNTRHPTDTLTDIFKYLINFWVADIGIKEFLHSIPRDKRYCNNYPTRSVVQGNNRISTEELQQQLKENKKRKTRSWLKEYNKLKLTRF